jgi:hypothetical protein
MKLEKTPASIYLIVVAYAFIRCTYDGFWGDATTLSLLLTLPWSLSMSIYAWGLIHGGAGSLMIFLIPFAALNFFILLKMPSWFRKRRQNKEI